MFRTCLTLVWYLYWRRCGKFRNCVPIIEIHSKLQKIFWHYLIRLSSEDQLQIQNQYLHITFLQKCTISEFKYRSWIIIRKGRLRLCGLAPALYIWSSLAVSLFLIISAHSARIVSCNGTVSRENIIQIRGDLIRLGLYQPRWKNIFLNINFYLRKNVKAKSRLSQC